MTERNPQTTQALRTARRSLEHFGTRFGDRHVLLAALAAVPIALTPELLYKLWYVFGLRLGVPWVAVADLLLSPLCVEVGFELDELTGSVREELLRQARQHNELGEATLREVAEFLLIYAGQAARDGVEPEFAASQRWAARLVLDPLDALQELDQRVIEHERSGDEQERERLLAMLSVSLAQLELYPELLARAQELLGFTVPEPFVLESSPTPIPTDAELAEQRWSVVISALEDTELLRTIWPLVELRMNQMGVTPPEVTWREKELVNSWWLRHSVNNTLNLRHHWGQTPPVLLYRPGETLLSWLGRHGVVEGSRNRKRLPRMLMLIGRPGPLSEEDGAYIPYNFQYNLAMNHAVGRLCFTDAQGHHNLAGYSEYVAQMVDHERRRIPATRKIAAFAPKIKYDPATRRLVNELVLPLNQWWANPNSPTQRLNFHHESFIEEKSTRANLQIAFANNPSLFVFGGPGLVLPIGDQRLTSLQGALVCQDWPGEGQVKPEHWLSAGDLPEETKVQGTFAFLFASYSIGSPTDDEVTNTSGIAPFDFASQLPQALLRRGALGIFGYIDAGWTYTFSGLESVRSAFLNVRDFLDILLLGGRAGIALEPMSHVYRTRSVILARELELIRRGKVVDDFEVLKLWMARSNARNILLLGDPAARLYLVQ